MGLDKSKLPPRLSALPDLDFTNDLAREPLEGPWFRLATCMRGHPSRKGRVQSVHERECLLIPRDAFPRIFDRLSAVGNTFGSLGVPSAWLSHEGAARQYGYSPFHEFHIPRTDVTAEPVAFIRRARAATRIVLNPDLWLFFDLAERAPGDGVWWDSRRGVEAVKTQPLGDDLLVVDIQTAYLTKYLEARQMSLLVGHYQHAHLFNPTPDEVARFGDTGDLVLGSPEVGVRAELNNWGMRDEPLLGEPFLQRRMHFWFIVEPSAVDAADPWAAKPSFDLYTFALPARGGEVAPARFAHFRRDNEREFVGESADFMTRVFFRQDVLAKYQGMTGFTVDPDGSLHCGHYWSLDRSTVRIGNELLSTLIGDFAEGVPFDEWPHWQQYAVEPPSAETILALREEVPIPDAVARIGDSFSKLNSSLRTLAAALGNNSETPAWDASLQSLAGKQLQWVYPAPADDDEFLKRATLLATFVVDGLNAPLLRKLLKSLSPTLHLNNDDVPRPLGSRNLLQRLVLCARLLDQMRPDLRALDELVRQAEVKKGTDRDADLIDELAGVGEKTRELFAPLAFLYDLRVHGGVAHAPNTPQAAKAAARLGLPEAGWRRRHYLQLLKLVEGSVSIIAEQLDAGAFALGEVAKLQPRS